MSATMTFAATPGGGTHFVYDIRIASPIPGIAPIVRASLTRSISKALPGGRSATPRGAGMVDIVAANEEAATVQKALVAQASAMADTLARAFFDDPVFSWVLRGDTQRLKVLRRAFELFLRRVWLAEEQTFTTAGDGGVAVWEPPGQWKHGARRAAAAAARDGRGVQATPSARAARADGARIEIIPYRRPSPSTTTSRSSASIPPGRAAGSAARCSRR